MLMFQVCITFYNILVNLFSEICLNYYKMVHAMPPLSTHVIRSYLFPLYFVLTASDRATEATINERSIVFDFFFINLIPNIGHSGVVISLLYGHINI